MLRSKYQEQTRIQLDSDQQTPATSEADCRSKALQSFLKASAEYFGVEGSNTGHCC